MESNTANDRRIRLFMHSIQLMSPMASELRIEATLDNCVISVPFKPGKSGKILIIDEDFSIPYMTNNNEANIPLVIRFMNKFSYRTYSKLDLNDIKVAASSISFEEIVPLFFSNAPHKLFCRASLKYEASSMNENILSQTINQKLESVSIIHKPVSASQQPVKHKKSWKLIFALGFRSKIASILDETNLTEQIKKENVFSQLQSYKSGLYVFGNDSDSIIYRFDFEQEKFYEVQPPVNLKLHCYSSVSALPNGQFILTGGINKGLNHIVSSSFRYNPISNTAQLIYDMQQARYTHASIYLNGYVYVVGGRFYGKAKQGVLSSCERYNLSTNTWEYIADMSDGRCATCLAVWKGQIYVFGGFDGVQRLKSIERYDSVTNNWEVIPLSMKIPIEAGVCVPLGDGQIAYIAGKDNVMNNSDVTVYDLVKGEYSEKGKLNIGRVLAKSALYKDSIYVFGGSSNLWEKANISNLKEWSTENYSYITNSEMKMFSATTSQSFIDVNSAISNDKPDLFYLIGMGDHSCVIVFELASCKYEILSPLDSLIPKEAGICPLPNGYVLIIGGRTPDGKSATKNCVYWNIRDNSTFPTSSLWESRYQFACIQISGFVYVVGGQNQDGKVLKSCERFDVRSMEWVPLSCLSIARRSAHLMPDSKNSKIYCFGGSDHQNTSIDAIELYDSQRNEWCLLPIKLPSKISCIQAILCIKDDTFLVFGGLQYKEQYLIDFSSMLCKEVDVGIGNQQLSNKIVSCSDNSIFTWCYQSNKWSQTVLQDSVLKWTEKNFSSSNLNHNSLSEPSKLRFLGFKSNNMNNCEPFGIFDQRQMTDVQERDASLYILVPGKDPIIISFNLKFSCWDKVNIPLQTDQIPHYSAAIGLPDGRIVLSGGTVLHENTNKVTSAASVFNPLNISFKPISSMNTPRFNHKLILIKSGIYAIGGETFLTKDNPNNEGTSISSCEYYNIRENEWKPTSSLNHARKRFGASAISNKIYVFGGFKDNEVLNSIERYNEEDKEWELLPKIFVPSGLMHISAISLSCDEIMLIGESSTEIANSQSNVLSFDPYLLSFSEKNPTIYNRRSPFLATRGNKLFAIGGSKMNSSESLSLTSHPQWTPTSSYEHLTISDLSSASAGISRLEFDIYPMNLIYDRLEFSQLYLFGTNQTPKILKLDLIDATWKELSVPEGLSLYSFSVAVSLPTGKIFLSGGVGDSTTDIQKSAFMLDFHNKDHNYCEKLPDMTYPRYTHTACFLSSYVYCIGGRAQGQGTEAVLDKCERYNVIKKEWQTISSLRNKRCTAVSIAYINRVYVFGGFKGDSRVKAIERYNEVQNAWEIIPFQLLNSVDACTLIPISRKEILLLGGKDEVGEQGFATIYDLERLAVRTCRKMNSPRVLSKVAKYQDKIFVIGGNSDSSCEVTKLGEWKWSYFDSYSSLAPGSLTRFASAQSI